MAKMAADQHFVGPQFWDAAQGLLTIAFWLLSGLALVGSARLSWLPGWGRHLRQAQEAAATAALLEAGAPPDVVSSWLRETKSLRPLSPAPVASDLLALSAACAQRAERAMQRFLIFYRYLGFALFGLVALGTTLDVYATCASMARIT